MRSAATMPTGSAPADSHFLDSAQRTLRTEIQALELLGGALDADFAQACRLMLACQGRVVVTGMGKSGHIARKIAATLASTGTPSFFMHPGEAAHGDLGMLVAGDVLLAISNSGESDEIMRLIPAVQRHGIALITISRDREASMPRAANVALVLGRAPEACPLGLAPTSSTTATLALGDALAIALLETRGFTSDDFALSHPAGALGRRLLTRLSDVMHTGADMPVVQTGTALRVALMEMTSKRLGMTAVVDAEQRVVGIFTDGDLRRTLDRHQHLDLQVDEVMNTDPVCLSLNSTVTEALEFMDQRRINQLLLVDAEHRLLGVATVQDLLHAGVR